MHINRKADRIPHRLFHDRYYFAFVIANNSRALFVIWYSIACKRPSGRLIDGCLVKVKFTNRLSCVFCLLPLIALHTFSPEIRSGVVLVLAYASRSSCIAITSCHDVIIFDNTCLYCQCAMNAISHFSFYLILYRNQSSQTVK